MITAFDYSFRRGVLVPLLKQIYTIISQNVAGTENIITWQQKMRKNLIDINWRFIIAVDGANLLGFIFYRYANSHKEQLDFALCENAIRTLQADCRAKFDTTQNQIAIYIEEMQIAKGCMANQLVLDSLVKKLEQDQGTKDATLFANDRMKKKLNKEILASVGFKDVIEGGWENLGGLTSTINALKIRYSRG